MWSDIIAHPPIGLVRTFKCSVRRGERIGDTTASGGLDSVLTVTGERSRGVAPDGVPFVVEPALTIGQGHATIGERDGHAVVTVRTHDGEYEAGLMFGEVKGRNMPEWRVSDEAVKYSAQVTLHAALYQRQRQARESAVAVPIQAGAVVPLTSAGRSATKRALTMGSRVDVEVTRPVIAKRQREVVTVTVKLPQRSRAKGVRVVADEPMFPELVGAERRQLPALAGEALARVLTPRGLQAVLAGMAIVYSAGSVELDDDGELPAKFRTRVMELMGMPSHRASASQREIVANALRVLVHAELQVTATTGESEYLPILVRHGYHDDPSASERRAKHVGLNPTLLSDQAMGRRWLVPEALFQVGDTEDADGVLRLMGLGLSYRLGMGTKSTKERLKLLALRSGCWEWIERTASKRGWPHVMRELVGVFDRLRALPHGDGRTDVIGSTRIVGTTMEDAVVVYSEPPAWARSSE